MNVFESIENEILELVKPTPEQLAALRALADMVGFSLRRGLKLQGLKARVSVEGSFAKGTLLSDKREIDVFVLFEDVDDEWIEKNSIKVLEKCLHPFRVKRKHAQHPYLTVLADDLSADVVPARLIESPSQSKLGVSRTPFHTEYVKSKIRMNPRLADEIRLLKSFMKGVGVYGAETGKEGFSGYLAELLVINYGGFRETLREATKWTPPIYIDVEGVGSRGELEKKYRGCPLIVVDPVDPERNAGAAVSLEKLGLFILASRMYLQKPDKIFFHVYSEKSRVSSPAVIAYFEGDYSTKAEAVVLGKLKRVSEVIETTLREYGFKPAWRAYGFEEDIAIVVVGLESLELPHLELREGPRAWDDLERTIRFISKRIAEGGYVWLGSDGRLLGFRRRASRHVADILATLASRLSSIMPEVHSIDVCEDSWRCIRESGVSLKSLIEYPLYAWMKSTSTTPKH